MLGNRKGALAIVRALKRELAIDADIRKDSRGGSHVEEATLHGDAIYVAVNSRGILVRTCAGRRDYVGGPNHWAARDLSIARLVAWCRAVAAEDESLAPTYSLASRLRVNEGGAS